ncbi:Nucleotidyl_cyclase [Hexamita inflata]|uniref:Nucleotidyl cyclase n=1 Tax=Hexamita inflata TaxID=28002 RepID=A0AA86TWA8_9EUKA|nr:Nucleotidyl cyclase [Hexamita inflata]
MIQQVDIFRLYIKVQIVTSIYTLATFIIEGSKYQMPLWCRLYQISDMLFFAFLSGKLWTYTRDLSDPVIKGRIFGLVSVQIYCRLISLILSVLFINKQVISLLYVLTFVHSITLSFLSIIFIPQKTMVQFCLYVAAICVYLFINTFSGNILHSLLVTFTFYMLPIYGTSFDKQMQTFVNVQKTVQQVNKMGNVIINAFQNALPSKLIPKVMSSKRLPCEVVKNVHFCYLGLKSVFESVEHTSKINQFYQMLDTLSDALGVQKIKCSSQYYMCCTNAQGHLENNENFELKYDNAYDCSKIIITYAAMATQIAELFELECSCGITRGDMIMGTVSFSSSVINFDIYGDTVNTAARLASQNNGVCVKIDDFFGLPPPKQSKTHVEDSFNECFHDQVDMTNVRKIILKSHPLYSFGNIESQNYKGKGNINVIEILALDQLKLVMYHVMQKAYAELIGDFCFNQLKDNLELNLELFDNLSKQWDEDSEEESMLYSDLMLNRNTESNTQFDLSDRINSLKEMHVENLVINNSNLNTTDNNTNELFSQKQSAKTKTENRYKSSTSSSKNVSSDHLLKPNIQYFLEKAKLINDLHANKNQNSDQKPEQQQLEKIQEKMHIEASESQSQQQNISFSNISDPETDSEVILNNLEFQEILDDQLQNQANTSELSLTQKPNELEIRYDLINIHKFMNNFSKQYCELMCNKIDVFEIWVNAIDLRYSNYELIVVLLNTLINNMIFTNYNTVIYVLSYKISSAQTCKLLNYFYCSICAIFNLYQRNYHQQLKKQLNLQKQKHNKAVLHNLLWGSFHSINKWYQTFSTSIDVLKMIIFVKTIQKYENYKDYAEIYKIYLTMIAHIFVNQCTLSAKGHFCSNMTPIISFNFWGKFLQVLFKAIIFSISMPILSVCYISTNIINTFLQYSKCKHIMIDSILKSDLHEKIQHGKKLLQNFVPQLSIEALLLTTIEKNSQDITILSKDKYQVKMLFSIDELIASGSLPRLQQGISQTISLDQDYHWPRFCQLTHRFLNLPNTQSYGQKRPLIYFGEVVYLNLNVCSFTQFCSYHSTEENMKFLQTLFTKFDNRIKMTSNLIQVKTSGDSYELMSLPTVLKQYSAIEIRADPKYLELRQYESIIQLISIGLGFIQDCKQVLVEYPDYSDIVGIRAGISFGEVTGSLLGNKMCKFDTFGPVPIRAELAQMSAEKNSIFIDDHTIEKMHATQQALKDYVVDYITRQQELNRVVDYESEDVRFEMEDRTNGKLITKIL